MVYSISKNTIPFYISCKKWSSNNLVSKGVNMHIVLDKDVPKITLQLDGSVNLEDQDSQAYQDVMELQKKADRFDSLTINEPAVIMNVFENLKTLKNIDNAEYMLEIKLNDSGKSHTWKVFMNVQANKLKLAKKK